MSHPDISAAFPVFEAAMVVGGIAYLVFLWRRAPDRSRAAILEQAPVPLLIAGVGAGALTGGALHRDGELVVVAAFGCAATLIAASKAVRLLDWRADIRRRKALGQAPRRVRIPPTLVGAMWAAVAFAVSVLIFIAVFAVGTEVLHWKLYDPQSPPTVIQQVINLAAGIVWLGAVIGSYHIGANRQRRKVAADNKRIAELDRRVVNDDPESNTTT